ncbi:unnamed protein product [Trichobilharzia regenti]|nr:unnamed protein product [Trichobilharzia regenti]
MTTGQLNRIQSMKIFVRNRTHYLKDFTGVNYHWMMKMSYRNCMIFYMKITWKTMIISLDLIILNNFYSGKCKQLSFSLNS